MVQDLETDYADVFAKLLVDGCAEGVTFDSYIEEVSDQSVLRYLIVSLLGQLFPEINRPQLDLQTRKHSVFDEVVISLINGQWHSLVGLSYIEKLIACNLAFLFDCVEPSIVAKITKNLEYTFTERSHVMTKFLLQEEEARSDAFLLLGYNLVDLAARHGYTNCKTALKELYYERIEEMEKSFDTDLLVLAEVVYMVAREISCKKLDWSSEAKCQTLNSFRDGDLDLLVAYTGSHRGVGSLAFKDVQVVTFGPQVGDIGQSDCFGIDFFTSDQNYKSIEVTDDGMDFRGWSRPSGSRDVWVEHRLKKQEKNLELIVSYEIFSSQDIELSEIFYVRADEIRMDKQTIKKGSLNRHKSFDRRVEIVLNNEIVTIDLKSEAVCQIIPLAGGPYYWSSDFIVAFEFERGQEHLHLTFSNNLI